VAGVALVAGSKSSVLCKLLSEIDKIKCDLTLFFVLRDTSIWARNLRFFAFPKPTLTFFHNILSRKKIELQRFGRQEIAFSSRCSIWAENPV
jgi:hypothetical protein